MTSPEVVVECGCGGTKDSHTVRISLLGSPVAMSDSNAAALDAAARLWNRSVEAAEPPADHQSVARMMLAVLESDLTRWIGAAGYSALLARAWSMTVEQHPSLAMVATPGTGAATDAPVVAYSQSEIATAVTALIAALMELLGRIIGEKMAIQLVQHLAIPNPRSTASNQPRNLANE